VRDGVIEGGEVEVSNPPHSASIVAPDSLLKGTISALPSSKEEDAIWTLKDVAEYDFELEWCAFLLHALGGEIRKGLKDDLIFDA
jgi:hypothetical protein